MAINYKKWLKIISLIVLIAAVMTWLFSSRFRAQRLAQSYLHYTNPRISTSPGIPGMIQFFFVDKYYKFRLKSMLAEDCVIESHFSDGRINKESRKDFANSFTGIRFTYNGRRITLKKPVVMKDSNDVYVSTFRNAYCDGDTIFLVDSQITVAKDRAKINHITNFIRDPNDAEVKQVRKIMQSGIYSLSKGLAGENIGRYGDTLCFSPDGKSLILSMRSDNGSYEIYSIDIGSSNLRRLTKTKYSEVEAFFTPDGKNIVFMGDKDSYLGEPYLIDADGSNYRRLLPQYFGMRNVTYSPNGSLIAFTIHNGRSEDIYVMNTDGTNIKMLTEDGRQKNSLVFSQDSKKILFQEKWYDYNRAPPRCEEIYSADINSLELCQLTNNCKCKDTLFATNQFVLYRTQDDDDDSVVSSVRMMSLDEKNDRQILGGNTHGTYYDLAVSPDYKLMAFVDDIDKEFCYELYIKELSPSGYVKRITTSGGCNGANPVFSPDGKFLVFEESVIASESREIKIFSIEDGKVRTLAQIVK